MKTLSLLAFLLTSQVLLAQFFSEDLTNSFPGLFSSTMTFTDVDGDDDQDVVLAGSSFIALARIARLYTNNGNGFFTQESGTPFEGVDAASIAFSDVDGDNDPDLFINGFGSSEAPITKLYTNDGDGDFSEVSDLAIVDVSYGGLAIADVDGDSDEDVIISGQSEALASLTRLYRNNDQGTFLNQPAAPFNFNLFPNLTADDEVFARFRIEEAGLLHIHLFTVDGQLVRRQEKWINSGENQLTIDCSDLANGSYFLQINEGIKTGTRRFLIQR